MPPEPNFERFSEEEKEESQKGIQNTPFLNYCILLIQM
jgi:hypothetical protein